MEWTRRAVVGGLAVTILPQRTGAAETSQPGDGFTILEAAPGDLRLLPAPAADTAVLAYNGQVPGPLIRVTKGDEVKVRLVNRLAQPTSLTWHGVRIVNAMDGVAGLTQAPVPPGAHFDYRFTPPDAGLYWYHPHVFPQSAAQIGLGLYGLLVVDERDALQVDQDLLVVIDDWTLDTKGQIVDPETPPREDHVGPLVTVNSKPIPGEPIVVRPGARLRLRLVNVCAARIAIITLAGMEALVIAIDGQASEVFPPAGGALPIGPGARFEVILDMPRDAAKTPTLVLRGETEGDQPLLIFLTKGEPIPARPRISGLPGNPLLPTRIPLEKSIKLTLVLGGASPPAKPKQATKPATRENAAREKTPAPEPWLWTIDGHGSDGFSGKPLFRVRRGGAVTLAFVNKTRTAQQMHVHGHVFRVLHDLDDGWDPYWRESILIGPGRTKHVAFIADNPGKWAIESLTLDRQVSGMATWFEVG